MYVPVEYKAAIVKNTKDADMLFGRGDGGEAGLLFVETPKDVEKTHPYLHADIREILTKKFGHSIFPNKTFQTYDAQCIISVNRFESNHAYVYRQNKPVVWRYSKLFVDFLIEKISKDERYLFTMREKNVQILRSYSKKED